MLCSTSPKLLCLMRRTAPLRYLSGTKEAQYPHSAQSPLSNCAIPVAVTCTAAEDPALYKYLLEHTRETDIQQDLRIRCESMKQPGMMASPDEYQFLGWLAGTIGAKRRLKLVSSAASRHSHWRCRCQRTARSRPST